MEPRKLAVTTRPVPLSSGVTSIDSGRTSASAGPDSTEPGSTGTLVPRTSTTPSIDDARQRVRQSDELRDERRRRPVVELRGGGDLLEHAGAHDADPVGDAECLLLVVRDEERRRADLELDPPDLVAQLAAHLGVERRQRLVEQQDHRLDGQSPGQRDPLLLAARHLVGK